MTKAYDAVEITTDTYYDRAASIKYILIDSSGHT